MSEINLYSDSRDDIEETYPSGKKNDVPEASAQLDLFDAANGNADKDSDFYDENGRAILGSRAIRDPEAVEAGRKDVNEKTRHIDRPFEQFANPEGRSPEAFENQMRDLFTPREGK